MRFLLLLPLLTLGSPAQDPAGVEAPAAGPAAQDAAALEEPAAPTTLEKGPFAGMEFLTGAVQLPEKIGRLALDNGYRYLGPSNARKVLAGYGSTEKIEGLLGIVIPPGETVGNPGSWMATLSYFEGGHISDDDMAQFDTEEFMDQLKELNKKANKELKAKGGTAYELQGWAYEPDYTPRTKIFTSGKRFLNKQAGPGEQELVFHENWVLGRRGMIVVQAYAPLGRKADKSMQQCAKIAGMIQFSSGNRHKDFNPGSDPRSQRLPGGTEDNPAVMEAKKEISRVLMRKLPWLLVVGLALLVKKGIDKMREGGGFSA